MLTIQHKRKLADFMAKFISALAYITWAAGILGAIICFTSDLELFFAGFGVLIGAGIEGALLYALSMILTNTQTTVAECANLKTQLNAVQEKLSRLENRNVQPAEAPAYQAAPAPAKVTIPADSQPAQPASENKSNLISCPKCGRKQMRSNKVCFECGTPLVTDTANN